MHMAALKPSYIVRGPKRTAGNGASRRPGALRISAMAGKTVTIRTKPTPVEFGQSISVVSNANSWETSAATELSWTEGDVWQGELKVPSDVASLEFKLVKMANGEVIEWEEGENKSCVVSGKGSKILECTWGTNEVMEKKAARKRSSSSKKNKGEAVAGTLSNVTEEAAVVEENVVEENVVEENVVEENVVEENVVEEIVVEQAVVEQSPATDAADSETFDHVAASLSGDEIMYTFDEEDYGESAADIARRIYGS